MEYKLGMVFVDQMDGETMKIVKIHRQNLVVAEVLVPCLTSKVGDVREWNLTVMDILKGGKGVQANRWKISESFIVQQILDRYGV